MSTNSNQLVNPQAREAMDRFKMEAANEVGVNLKQGYNGDLTSRQAGSIGGQMVKNVLTVRLTKKASFERENRIVDGHKQTVRYIAGIAI
ncbi:MAG: alpha/beta-type small acid-soluble spore protein [Oscillospiraceae bacterium]|nr:alpha/beta-type small acid-soluble spore protein [Oscillospiraceae bacterium]